MILRRLTANLRAQNWTAITLEFLIVVIGVFIGTQVSNWNQERNERRETERMLEQFLPELQTQVEFFDAARTYFATSRRYADQALAAWAGNKQISDERFVIAAYQASQIFGIGINPENWTLTFGGEQLRNIEDPRIRRDLELVLTQAYDPVDINAVATPYREQVRRVIPARIQDRIRAECGDRSVPGRESTYLSHLPQTCPLRLAPAEAREAAAALRARPELAQELNWHLAAVAVYLENAAILERPVHSLHRNLLQLAND
jgi:hypothetical protein